MAYTNRFYIDGKDARAAYGASLLEGSYKELLCPPPLKKVESNDWAEYDGLEPDLSSPVLDSRDVKLPVYVRGGESAANAFIKAVAYDTDEDSGASAIQGGAYHVFDVKDLGRSWKLRLKSVDIQDYWPGSGGITLSVTLADDFPLDGYTYLEPESGMKRDESCMIGGRPFSDYGMMLTEGGLKEALLMREVKEAMLRDISVCGGAIYDPLKPVRYKDRTIELPCFMRADTLAQYHRNMDAFMYDLTRPGLKTLKMKGMSEQWDVFYDSTDMDYFMADRLPVTCSFKLKLHIAGRHEEEES